MATRQAPVDATALIRGMFHKVSNKPQPGMGVFPSDWLESSFMPAAVRKVTSVSALHDFSLQYGEPWATAACAARCRRSWRAQRAAVARADHHHRGRHARAGHRQPHPAAPRRPVMVEEPGWAVEFARLTRWACACCRCRAAPTGPTWR
jgi:hypothetical protein